MNDNRLDHYRSLFDSLKTIIAQSESRITVEEDTFFVEHANFLVKSFLICMCSYLESFLKELVNEQIDHFKGKVATACIPHNLVQWQIHSAAKNNDWKFSNFSITIDHEAVDDMLSANIHRTIATFRHIGIDLSLNEYFENNKSIIGSVVDKRNSIVHHNDSANDITLGDIVNHIAVFVGYIESLDALAMGHR